MTILPDDMMSAHHHLYVSEDLTYSLMPGGDAWASDDMVPRLADQAWPQAVFRWTLAHGWEQVHGKPADVDAFVARLYFEGYGERSLYRRIRP